MKNCDNINAIDAKIVTFLRRNFKFFQIFQQNLHYEISKVFQTWQGPFKFDYRFWLFKVTWCLSQGLVCNASRVQVNVLVTMESPTFIYFLGRNIGNSHRNIQIMKSEQDKNTEQDDSTSWGWAGPNSA